MPETPQPVVSCGVKTKGTLNITFDSEAKTPTSPA
jgi:hypothetical protein